MFCHVGLGQVLGGVSVPLGTPFCFLALPPETGARGLQPSGWAGPFLLVRRSVLSSL